MKHIKDMDKQERRVFDSIWNGWYLSGVYQAKFDDHERTFDADSRGILFSEVNAWFKEHREHHADANMLVKCVKAC